MTTERKETQNYAESGIKPGENYAGWKTEKLTKEQFEALSEEERLNYLITCAHLAPSTHNTQPWAFKTYPDSNSIEVFLDRGEYKIENGQTVDKRRVLPASDVVGRQSCISLGCAIANLLVAASHFDLKPNFTFEEINPEQVKPIKSPEDKSERYIKVGKFSLVKKTETTEEIDTFDAIFTRRMNRGKYNPAKTISQEIIDVSC